MNKSNFIINTILVICIIILIVLINSKTNSTNVLNRSEVIPKKQHLFICELKDIIDEDNKVTRTYNLTTNDKYYIISGTIQNDIIYKEYLEYSAMKTDLENNKIKFEGDDNNLHLIYKEDIELETDEMGYIGNYITLLEGYSCREEV